MKSVLALGLFFAAGAGAASRALAQDAAPAASGRFAETLIDLPVDGSRLAFRDVDGDGAAELLWIHREGIGLRFLDAEGRFPSANDLDFPWPHENLAWDLADLDGDGATELVAIEDSKTVRAFDLRRGDGFGAGRTLLEKVDGRLPRGKRHVRFARDVDGDGRPDVVVPGSSRYRIFLSRDELSFAPPIEVSFEASISYGTGDPRRLDEEFGMELTIPWFELEDVDGDGRTDLVSETEDFAQFHLASPELPAEPTWRLDKLALREGAKAPTELDFEDLFALLAGRVDWRIEDLDGAAPRDLIVQQGSTFKVYLGGSRSGNERPPDDLLKSSGHVLTFLLHDLGGDGRPELLMIRAEKLSLGRVVRWLVLPGSLDFDVFAYENEGLGFGKRPMSRVALSLKIPRLLSFFEELKGMEDELEARLDVPTTVGAFDADGLANDVVDLRGGEVVVFRDCAPKERGIDWRDTESLDFDDVVERFLLERIEGLEDGETRDIDLAKIKDIDLSPAEELRRACAGKEPRLVHPLGFDPKGAVLVVVDVDKDGISDVVMIDETKTDKGRRVQILVTRE